MWKEKHRLHNNQYCKLQNMQKVIVRCWISSFGKIQLSGSKIKSNYMNQQMDPLDNTLATDPILTGCGFPLNRTQIDHSGLLMTQMVNVATVRFWPGRGPEATVRKRC